MKLLSQATRGRTLRSWDCKQAVEVRESDLAAALVNPAELSAALLEAAKARGTQVTCDVAVAGLQLGEREAVVELSTGKSLAAQVVLIADGADSPTARLARLAAARNQPTHAACALAVFDAPGKTNGKLELVLGAGNGLRMALMARQPGEIRVHLMTHDASTTPDAQLRGLIERAQAAGVLPAGGRMLRPSCLGGVALEMESHVGKRCLLIGDAGGFVSAFSHDGLYPALRSGWLAAEAVARAMKARLLQDELSSFSAAWRADLADYLRMPGTDLSLLLPMVFNNAQMSGRVARAFLFGQSF